MKTTTTDATTWTSTTNETSSIGIFAVPDGFVALTLSASQTFKTRKGAEQWLARRGYAPNGSRLAA